MTRLPDTLDYYRSGVFSPYLRGSGIEIGPSDRPVPIPPEATVTYVDFHLEEYPDDFRADDGFTLHTFLANSLDFIIACHVMEHSPDLFGSIHVHREKLRVGGVLCYILPDRARTVEHRRRSTTIAHHLQDFRDGGVGTYQKHLTEWADVLGGLPGPEALPPSVHFHSWTAVEQRRLWAYIGYHFGFQVSLFVVPPEWPECLAVLRKEHHARATEGNPNPI